MQTIRAKLIISRNDLTIKKIRIKLTIEDSLTNNDIREEIRVAANLTKDDEFNKLDLSDGCFVNPSHFLGLDPDNSDHSFRINIIDHSGDDKWKADFEKSVKGVLDQENHLEKVFYSSNRQLYTFDNDTDLYNEWFKNYHDICSKLFNDYVKSREHTERLVRLGIINKYQKYLIDSLLLVDNSRGGVLPCEKNRTDRHRTVFELFTDLRNNTKLQITSPPGSGKSALAALLIRYVIIIKKRNVLYIPCSHLGDVTEISSHSSFIKHLASKLLHVYDLLLENRLQDKEEKTFQIVEKLNKLLSDNTVVITDGSQRISKAIGFWRFVIKNNPCLLLCLNTEQFEIFTLDRTSPIELENKRSLELVRFRRYEFDELIDKMIGQVPEFNRISFSKRVRDQIFVHTGGYPCLVFRSIQFLIDNLDELDNLDKVSNYNYYFGVLNRFFTVIKNVGCFPSSKEIIDSLLKAATNNATQIDATSLLQRCLKNTFSNLENLETLDLSGNELAADLDPEFIGVGNSVDFRL